MKRLKLVCVGLTVWAIMFGTVGNASVNAQFPKQNDEQILAYSKYKTVEVLLGYGEAPYKYQSYYSYYDGIYRGTLWFSYLERRPGLGGKNYVWYAVYRGIISTGASIIPNQVEMYE